MPELEAISIADVISPETPPPTSTPLEKAVASPSVNLKELQKLSETPELPPIDATPAAEAETPEATAARKRDENGRFTAKLGEQPTETPADDDDTVDVSQAPGDWRKRIERLRKRRADDRAALDTERQLRQRLEQELLALRRPPGPSPAPPSPAPAAAPAKFPGYDDYLQTHAEASYEDYLDARAEAKIEARLTADRQRLEADSASRAAHHALTLIQSTAKQQHADYEAIEQAAFARGMQFAPHVTAFMLRETESPEEASELTYALLKDPALVTKLNMLPPARAHYELGKLTATLSTSSSAAPGPEGPTAPVTRAPAPLTPVGTSATTSPQTVESLVKGSSVNLKRLAAAVGERS